MKTGTPKLTPSPDASPITPEIIQQHGITAEEYQKIVRILNREPTFTELGIFSVMWSEHCSYKSSRIHLKRLPTRSKLVVQGPGENAGIIEIGDGWACAFKIESHNHPSFIEPFQGAATGVGGILRDIFTMGARPLAVMDSIHFGPIIPARGNSVPSSVHKNQAILEGVVSGIASYGNCFGVPNFGGETRFEDCYSQNPLVNVFALGLVRRDEIFYARAGGEGNPVIYVGAKTGRDGIHGATMASAEFTEGSQQKRPNVQVGDPFLEKLLLEACLEAMQTGAIVGIQDMGAAGLTCSTCEMGGRGGVGIEIELDSVPQRESGMTAYEIMLSESQERMLLVAAAGREEEVFAVFEKWGLDAVTVGRVTTDGKLRVLEHGRVVAEIPNHALTDDAPLYKRPMQPWSAPVPREKPPQVVLLRAPGGPARDLAEDLKHLLSSPNLSSKRWIFEQYDTMVQTNTVQGPGGDAGVMRIKGSNLGLAMALDSKSRWCYLDPRLGAMHTVAEAARKVACAGGRPVAATNCLNFGNPEKPQIMWQFSEVVDGIAAACTALGTPITGGNVSLYNETLGEGIFPTPVIGVVGILEQIVHTTTISFTAHGRSVILLHKKNKLSRERAETEFGSSAYAKEILNSFWGTPPELDLKHEAALQACMLGCIQAGLLDSAHDCSEGGIAVALAESGFAKGIGARINLPAEALGASSAEELPPEISLFGEEASRILVSCDPARLKTIRSLAVQYGLEATLIGETAPEVLDVQIADIQIPDIQIADKPVLNVLIKDLKRAWEGALEQAVQAVQAVHADLAGQHSGQIA